MLLPEDPDGGGLATGAGNQVKQEEKVRTLALHQVGHVRIGRCWCNIFIQIHGKLAIQQSLNLTLYST